VYFTIGMLKGLFLGIALSIVLVGAAWLIVAGINMTAAPEIREIPVPYPVTIVDSGMVVQVNQLKAENTNLQAQLTAAREDLSVCQQKIYYGTSSYGSYSSYDDYRADLNYRTSGEWDLTVRVRDDDTGDPIEDARVRVMDGDSDSDYTDEDGEAFFSNLEEDCYDVTVRADGYDDESDEICLEDNERITIRMMSD
jgi:hypothetical protein